MVDAAESADQTLEVGDSANHAHMRTHSDSVIVDIHSDIPLDIVKRRRKGENCVLARRHLPPWMEGGVNAAVLAVAGDHSNEESSRDYALESLGLLADDVAESSGQAKIVGTPNEVWQRHTEGRISIIPSIEGGGPLENSTEVLRDLWAAGIRVVTLTWNGPNALGGGTGTPERESGLTDFGRRVVRVADELGIIVDVAHASPKMFWDVINLDTSNVVASHCNATALCPHPRNLSDEQIRAIGERGGTIGICFYPGFLHGDPPSVDEVIDHIAHAAQLVGIEHVALGTDYIDFAPGEMAARLRASNISYDKAASYPTGLETIRSLHNLTLGMLRRGFTPPDVEWVLGKSFLKTWTRIMERT